MALGAVNSIYQGALGGTPRRDPQSQYLIYPIYSPYIPPVYLGSPYNTAHKLQGSPSRVPPKAPRIQLLDALACPGSTQPLQVQEWLKPLSKRVQVPNRDPNSIAWYIILYRYSMIWYIRHSIHRVQVPNV